MSITLPILKGDSSDAMKLLARTVTLHVLFTRHFNPLLFHSKTCELQSTEIEWETSTLHNILGNKI